MYIVRKVLAAEYGKYRKHLKSLDEASRMLRFGAPITDEVIDQLCDKIELDTRHHVLFAIENANLEFVAVGHVAMFKDIEMAFSVLTQYQGQGMGEALMKRVIQHCRTKGRLKGYMVCLPHNQAIKHLCQKHGIKIHTEYGEITADVELPAADAATYFNEAGSQNLGVLDFMSKRALLPWTLLA
jgi:GNAT superfamily N-acetyltransferase